MIYGGCGVLLDDNFVVFAVTLMHCYKSDKYFVTIFLCKNILCGSVFGYFDTTSSNRCINVHYRLSFILQDRELSNIII